MRRDYNGARRCSILDLGRRADSLAGPATLALALLAASEAADAGAQCVPPFHQKLQASDVHAGQLFGMALALDGTRLLVGASGDDGAAPSTGAAYVLDFDGLHWIEGAKLTAPDAAANDAFGFSCALTGDRALIGCPFDNFVQGAVYAFESVGGSWSFVQKILSPDPQFQPLFGASLAVSGDRFIVSAPYSSLAATAAGAAYVFRWVGTSWVLEQRLLPPIGPQAGEADHFGWRVGLESTRAVVSAPDVDTSGIDTGLVWIYEWDGVEWTPSAMLSAPDASPGDEFGRSLAVWEDKVLVGAPFANDASTGAAYAFEKTDEGWTQTAKLEPPQVVEDLNFGMQVALNGNHAMVYASGDDTAGTGAGAVWLFVDDGESWTRVAKIVGPDIKAFDSFGGAIALGPSRAVIGAFFHEVHAGAAYTYGLCSWIDIGGALPIHDGPARLSGSGPLAAGSRNELSLAGAPPSAPCLLLVAADAAGAAPFKGGVLKAFPVALVVPAQTSASGTFDLPFIAPSLPSGAAFVVQAAIADAGASAGVALSNALLATVP